MKKQGKKHDNSEKETQNQPQKFMVSPRSGAICPTGGVKGNRGGGRPPDEFRRKMRELASNPQWEVFLQECCDGVHGPLMSMKALEWLADRGYGKATQPISGEDGAPLTVIIAGSLE